MLPSLLVAALSVLPARAAEPEPAPTNPLDPATPAEAATPEQRLDEARRAYSQGRTSEARALLQSLLTLGGDLPPRVRRDTLAYLGDILYSEETPSAADPFFRALLDEQPGYTMDPLQHPDEVVRYFETLRPPPVPFDVVVVKPPEGPKRRPPPWLAVAPGGVYYFASGKIGPGLAVAGVQTALLVTNLVLYTQIAGMEQLGRGTAEVTEWRNLRLATDLVAGAFYVSLALPPAVELGRWGVENPKLAVGVGPGAVSVTGSF